MTSRESLPEQSAHGASPNVEPPGLDAGDRGETLCQQLRKAATLVDAAIDRKLAPHGLTARQYMLLRALTSNPGINQMGLSQLTSIDRSTMTEMITRLVSRDLVQRQRNPNDARSYVVRSTPAASQRLAQVQPLVSDVHASVWRSLDPDAVEAFERAMSALIGPLEQQAAD